MEQTVMLQIGDTIISLDIFNTYFICDLPKCHGACCVEGDSGAPLEPGEAEEIEALLPHIWDELSDKAKAIIEKQGISYIDSEKDRVTSIVDGRECAFTMFDEQGNCKCLIEKAWSEGKTTFRKPVSCHLYPIRTMKYPSFTAVNYDEWHICKAAKIFGRREGVAVYRFLKEPLIRKFGQEWYNELEIAAEELAKTRR
jgi:hypothetical protein